MDNRIIVIDDELDFLDSVRRGLITSGFKNVRTESDPLKAAADFENEEDYDICLIDITMPGMGGIELLEVIKTPSPKTECIMITAVDEARMAVQCLRKGAYDYLVKPISKEDLVVSLKRALERKRLVDILDLGKSGSIPKIVNMEAFSQIKTRSAKVFRILKEAELHAGSDVPVLITGETGTGKDLLLRTAARCLKIFWKVKFSVMLRGRLPARLPTRRDCLSLQTAAPYFWMKFPICPLRCTPICCGCFRSARFVRSAAANIIRWNFG